MAMQVQPPQVSRTDADPLPADARRGDIDTSRCLGTQMTAAMRAAAVWALLHKQRGRAALCCTMTCCTCTPHCLARSGWAAAAAGLDARHYDAQLLSTAQTLHALTPLRLDGGCKAVIGIEKLEHTARGGRCMRTKAMPGAYRPGNFAYHSMPVKLRPPPSLSHPEISAEEPGGPTAGPQCLVTLRAFCYPGPYAESGESGDGSPVHRCTLVGRSEPLAAWQTSAPTRLQQKPFTPSETISRLFSRVEFYRHRWCMLRGWWEQ
jgi:hypothetical protein